MCFGSGLIFYLGFLMADFWAFVFRLKSFQIWNLGDGSGWMVVEGVVVDGGGLERTVKIMANEAKWY